LSAPEPRLSPLLTGILWMTLGFFLFSILNAGAKWLVSSEYSTWQITFVRYFGSFALVLLFYLPREGISVFKSKVPGKQMLRGMFLLGSTIFNFAALSYLPLTVATAFYFAAPILVVLLAIPILGERVGLRRMIAVLIGFFGVLVIIQPWNAAELNWGILFGLIALFCASCYFVMTRMISGQDSNQTTQVFANVGGAVILAPIAMQSWIWPLSWFDWGIMGLVGLMGLLGHSAITVAHKYATASDLAPVIYTQIFFITALSWAIFDDIPGWSTWAGIGIIIASGFYIWLRERAAGADASGGDISGK